MADKRDNSAARDTKLARLLASAMESRVATSGSSCPDPDILAAYAEHALEGSEVSRWEEHFSDCARCQKVLAVLTVSGEDPLTEQEIARLGTAVGRAALPAEGAPSLPASSAGSASRPRSSAAPSEGRIPLWRWLVPAFGVAVAAMLWIALRPAGSRLDTTSVPQISAQKSQIPAAQGQSQQMAQANVPVAPTLQSSPMLKGPLAEGKDLDRLEKPENLAKQRDVLGEGADKKSSAVSAAPESEQAPSAAPSLPQPQTDARELRQAAPQAPEPAPKSQTQMVTVTGAIPQVSDSNAASESAIAPAPRYEPAQPKNADDSAQASAGGAAIGGRNAPMAARAMAAPMAKAAVMPTAFASPDGAVSWRVEASGRIERSTDQGKTWEAQASGVTADLFAGAAASRDVAWAIGRPDVVLRTEDGGEHWQRVNSPAASAEASASGVAGAAGAKRAVPRTGLASIQATDALRATVSSANGQRYTTNDGGQTWAAQP